MEFSYPVQCRNFRCIHKLEVFLANQISILSWSTSELRVRLVHRLTGLSPPVKYLPTVPRRYFFCGSFMFFLSCVCYAFVRDCLYMPCGPLLGKDCPLGCRLWCLTVSLSLSHWYFGSGAILDCINS